MRRPRIIAAAALAAALASATQATAANPQIAGLQVALRAQGLYCGAIDGIAGRATVAGTRAFQRLHHLPVTGRSDARTREQLGPLGRPLFGSRQLRAGMIGSDVAVLQFLLARQGIATPVNGYFDRPTLRALAVYQRRSRLAADAVAGARTLAVLSHRAAVPVPVAAHAARYVVRAGDSLTAIARRRGTTVGGLARLNGLDPAKPLLIGTRLRVPAARRTAVAAVPEAGAVRAALGRWARVYGIDPSLGRALAWMESGYRQSAVSSVGAVGVMQLLPSTWAYSETVLIGHPVPRTADGNIQAGMAYLRHLLRAFGGNERLALAAWYQGERAVKAHGPYKVSLAFVDDVLALRGRM